MNVIFISVMLHDVNVIRQMQSYIDLDDDLFSMEQYVN